MAAYDIAFCFASRSQAPGILVVFWLCLAISNRIFGLLVGDNSLSDNRILSRVVQIVHDLAPLILTLCNYRSRGSARCQKDTRRIRISGGGGFRSPSSMVRDYSYAAVCALVQLVSHTEKAISVCLIFEFYENRPGDLPDISTSESMDSRDTSHGRDIHHSE